MKLWGLLLLATGTAVMLCCTPVSAAEPNLTVQINGQIVNAPSDINVKEGQVMLPLRWAAEQLVSGTVQWDSETKTITIISPQDFYSQEKYDSYVRGIQPVTEARGDQIWPLPDKGKNLYQSYAMPNKEWVLELKQTMENDSAPMDSINIRITSEDASYEHSSVVYSAENRQGHYYVPMDWLEYLFSADVSYDPSDRVLSIQTPDMGKIKSSLDFIENALIPSNPDEAVKLWGRGEQERNGALQYAALSPELRSEADRSFHVLRSYWVTGFSSPWAGPMTITNRTELSDTKFEFTISFPELTSTPPYTTATEKLIVEKLQNNGCEGWYITQILQASGYGIDFGNN